jgi:FkbM family methyltransferase
VIPLPIRRHYAKWSLQCLYAAGIRTVSHDLAGGGKMILDTNNELAQRIRCEESFEPAVRQEVQRIASQGINVIDVGANIGYFTILASRLIGSDKRVFSFEPQARVVKQLRRNIEFNALGNVEVFQFALSDTRGVATFNIPPDGDEAFGCLQVNGRFTVVETVEVETRRLDDVFHDLGEPKIGLIKLDAEGAELLILRGATRLLSAKNKPCLIFEANEVNCRPFGYCVFDILRYVHSFGYRLRQLDQEDWIATAEKV